MPRPYHTTKHLRPLTEEQVTALQHEAVRLLNRAGPVLPRGTVQRHLNATFGLYLTRAECRDILRPVLVPLAHYGPRGRPVSLDLTTPEHARLLRYEASTQVGNEP